MKRVLIIANKSWEADPLINALLNAEFKPSALIVPQLLNHPRINNQVYSTPRAEISYTNSGVCFEIWCIQDLMGANNSGSQGKYISLPNAINYKSNKKPDFVIAFGTAASVPHRSTMTDVHGNVETNNGCVVIGSNVFIHDAHPIDDENPVSKLHLADRFEQEIKSNVSSNFFEQLVSSDEFTSNVERRLLKPYQNPSKNIKLIIDENLVGLSNVNITDFNEYKVKDLEGVATVINSGTKNEIGSVETTHGIIRILSEAPFIFVSGITDRVGYFDEDVTPRKESQNYTCAFNAGISIAWMIPEILSFLKNVD